MDQFKIMKNIFLLPTDKPSRLYYHKNLNKLILTNRVIFREQIDLSNHNYQHLYIITNEDLLPNEYGINTLNNTIIQNGKANVTLNDWKYIKRIIATTDTSLKVPYNNGDINNLIILPQPSQQFIEKYIEEYNKGNIITDVLVEYKEDLSTITKIDGLQHWDYKLKVNSKDNTITIKKLKDSWNREEVIENLITMHINLYGADKYALDQVNKWIEENL